MQPIVKLMRDTSTTATHQMKGRALLASHAKYLREHPNSFELNVDPESAYVYRYSFYAYLRSINLDVKIHWITMVINNLNSPEDFDENTTSIIIPPLDVVTDIINTADL